MTDRRGLAGRLAPLGLIAALAVALAVPAPDDLELPASDPDRVAELRSTLAGLADSSTVLVGFDPDVGTYAEIRPTVRALLAELAEHGAALEVVSLTPEGRALWIAEAARLARTATVEPAAVELGFLPGAEAALVSLARARADVPPDLVVLVGGNDVGPRMWVEQFAPRQPDVPVVAVAPTLAYPELRPYLQTGQLDALLATLGDGAAYRAEAPGAADERDPPTLALLVGMVLGIGALGQGVLAILGGRLRRRGGSSA